METIQPTQLFHFLQHGGEMGSLTRNHNWSQTSVGTPDTWQQSLRTTVSNLLRSSFPMFLWWGDDLIQFYNDAYRPSLGDKGKHPTALGQRGQECWPEIWPVIYPLIQQVLQTGEPTWMENQKIPIYRNGSLEDAYWTFSYSLVLNDDDEPGGVLVTCMETTESVQSQKEIAQSENRFQNLVREATTGIIVLLGEELKVEVVNDAYGQLIGRSYEDLIGKPLFTVIPETEAYFRPIIDGVRLSGEPLYLYEKPYSVNVAEGKKEGYLNLVYQPYKERDGTTTGVVVLCQDVTGQVLDRRRTEESEAKLRSILNSAPTAMGVFIGPGLIVENANQLMIEVMAAGPDIEGKSFRQLLTGLVEEDQKFLQIIDGVRTTGQPFEAREVAMFFKAEKKARYFNISFIPLHDDAGVIYAVLDVSVDVTEQVETRKKIEESEARSRSLVEKAPVATCLFVGREMVIEVANEAMIQVWGKGPGIVGLPLAEALPELKGQHFLPLLDELFTTGNTYSSKGGQADLIVDGHLQTFYFNYDFEPLRNPDGTVYAILETAVDVTAQVLAKNALEESEHSLRTMILQAPVAICIFRGPQFVIEIANEKMFGFWGKSPEEVVGKPLFEGIPEAAAQGYEQLMTNVLHTGESLTANELSVTLPRNGILQTVFINFTYQPLREKNGGISGIMAVAIDVIEQVLARKRVEESEQYARNLFYNSPVAVLVYVGPDMVLREANEKMLEIFGRGDGSIGKPIMEAIPELAATSLLENYRQVLETGITHREYADRILLMKGGRPYWGYYDYAYKALHNAAGAVYGVICTAIEVTEQVTARKQIEEVVKECTKELAEANTALQTSNKELQRSNANLEEFAHAASHDLKEPVRKIQFFTQHLKELLGKQLQDAELRSFARIENASERMGALIDDMLLYSHVSERPHAKEKVDLNEKVQRVLEDLELDVQERNALVHVGALPVVKGYRRQLQQLFQNLISNALKYSRKDAAPQIQITAASVVENERPYHLITVKDNGIGFEQRYEEKIFQMFSRLHGKGEYSGTGVGLSIVKKVVENHDGFIRVDSAVGKGSTFNIYLPAQ